MRTQNGQSGASRLASPCAVMRPICCCTVRPGTYSEVKMPHSEK
ncbi:MAG: hypothetical protein QM704_17745 [Anaeromyxobacteraceae bacterium]